MLTLMTWVGSMQLPDGVSTLCVSTQQELSSLYDTGPAPFAAQFAGMYAQSQAGGVCSLGTLKLHVWTTMPSLKRLEALA